jgi:hypothetical protein
LIEEIPATLNVAVAELFAVNVRLQVPVPLQAPDHPLNVEPVAGVAVRVTAVPLLNPALQVVPQLMPVGLLVIVPAPKPALCTVSCTEDTLNMAVTDVLAVRVAAQGPVPLQAPDQPAKVDPGAAVSVSVTWVPLAKLAVHVAPQLMPAGVLVTIPAPLPAN